MRLLLFALPFLLLVAGKDDDACTINTKDGQHYDLSSLSASKDYSIATSKADSPLILNVCKPVASETWGIDDPKKVGGYIRRAHSDFSVGQPNTTLYHGAGSLQLYMLGGSKCASGSTASTIIDFICDKSVFSAGEPRLLAQLPPGDNEACSFFVEWRTHVACPTGSRSGPWGFFVTLIVLGSILLMVYLTLGTLYNRFVLNLRGFDQVPSFSVEGFRYHVSEALDWFKDVMGGLYEGGQEGRYDILPRTNPVSHQSGVDSGDPAAGGFVRPARTDFVRSSTPSTNPVSHQSQVNASQSQPPPPPPPQQQQQQQQQQPSVQQRSVPVKEEERPFMLGDDEDETDDGPAVPTETSPASNASVPPPKADVAGDGSIRL